MTKQRALVFFLCISSAAFPPAQSYAKEKITFTPKKGSSQHEAKPASCEIQVFTDSKPDREYVELGIVNYHDERHRLNDKALKLEIALPKMKARACKVGGDAVIDVKVTEIRRLEFAMFNVRATVVRFTPK
jgi:hypothetical protein